MSDINPNTPVTESAPVVVQGGEQPTTFDELDALTKDPKGSKKVEPTKTSKDLSSDENKGKAQKPAPKAEGKEAKQAVEGETDPATELPAKKMFKFKSGDSDVELPEDALIDVPVDGKNQSVSLKDLRENFSGKIAFDKKFSDLNTMKRQVVATQAKLEQSAASIRGIFQEKNPDVRMYKMAQLAGIDPVTYKKNFLDQSLSMVEKYHAMSDDEKRAYILEEENKYLKYERETQTKSTADQQASTALNQKIDKLCATHKVSEDEFASRLEQVKKAAAKDPSIKITPEFIVDTISKDRMWDAADAKLKTLNLGWDQETTDSKLMSLVETSFVNGLSPQETAEIAMDLWGTSKPSSQQIASQKLEDKKTFLTGKKPVSKAAAPKGDAMFFDEL